MSTFRGLLSLAMVAAAASAATGAEKSAQQVAQLRRRSQQQGGDSALRANGFVRMLDFHHQLRVCNAYPMGAPMDVFRGKEESLTAGSPLPYKTCRDFHSNLRAGDKLEFRIGDQTSGTFSVSDLPNNDAVLLLVVHRHDTLSTAVAFDSHVFADLNSAQVAVIDTYRGKAQSTPKILDSLTFLATGKDDKNKDKNKPAPPRSEELRYNSVVAVSPGVYNVVLDGKDGLERSRSQLVALRHESYVVLRTGVEAQQGSSFPQELVIFPHPDAAQLRSAAATGCTPLVAALAVAMLASLLAA